MSVRCTPVFAPDAIGALAAGRDEDSLGVVLPAGAEFWVRLARRATKG